MKKKKTDVKSRYDSQGKDEYFGYDELEEGVNLSVQIGEEDENGNPGTSDYDGNDEW